MNITISTVNATSNKVMSPVTLSAVIETTDYEALFYPESGYYIDRGSVRGSMGEEDILNYIVPDGTYLKLYIKEVTDDIIITVTGKRRPQSAYIYPYINNASGCTNLLGSLRVL